MQIVLISGLSGSGKSIALHVLEDAGYYVVDNLPASLLLELVAHLGEAGYRRIAVAVDMRSGASIEALPEQMKALRGRAQDLRFVFLDARDETLVARFSETRRRHPLATDEVSLQEAIQREREALADVSALGLRIDTSDLHPNTLRCWIKDFIEAGPAEGLILMFQSFGFKHGIPIDADLVFDVRCLPNPYYDPLLRPLTGRDAAVSAFLDGQPSVQRLLGDVRDFLARWLPEIVKENRSYLTVAVGCTGGRHRSVYLAERLAAAFAQDWRVLVRHRGLARE